MHGRAAFAKMARHMQSASSSGSTSFRSIFGQSSSSLGKSRSLFSSSASVSSPLSGLGAAGGSSSSARLLSGMLDKSAAGKMRSALSKAGLSTSALSKLPAVVNAVICGGPAGMLDGSGMAEDEDEDESMLLSLSLSCKSTCTLV